MKKNNKMFISSEHSHQTVHILFIILIYLHILFIMTVHIIFIIRISYLNKPTHSKPHITYFSFHITPLQLLYGSKHERRKEAHFALPKRLHFIPSRPERPPRKQK